MIRQVLVASTHGRRTGCRSAFLLVLWGIGLLAGGAQCLRAQLPPGDGVGVPGWLSGSEGDFRERLSVLLLESKSLDYAAGFALAHRIGVPAAPLLREMLLKERSSAVRQSAALAGAMIAGGPALDPWLFEWLGQKKAIKEQRTMVALAIALGPPRERPIPEFWSRSLGLGRSPEEVLTIAVRLASARVPDCAKNAPALGKDEVGLLAASAYAGLPMRAVMVDPRWDLQERERHDELFWRGALLFACRRLAAGDEPDAETITRARAIAAISDLASSGAREVAWRYLAMAGEVRSEGPRPDHRVLRSMACDRAAARRIRAWLGPQPLPRDERQPERLAVSYVLSRAPAEVGAAPDRSVWSTHEQIRCHVAVALALQVLDEGLANAEEWVAVEERLPGVPEWQLVRWALGQTVTEQPCADPRLTVLIELAAAGRLPRAVGRQALEEALWRWGSHPEVGRFEAEQLLVRDLLLAGRGNYLPRIRPEKRYRPKGVGNEKFFDIAVSYYDFVSTRRPSLPHEYRLR